jgi:hypothetical protein
MVKKSPEMVTEIAGFWFAERETEMEREREEALVF